MARQKGKKGTCKKEKRERAKRKEQGNCGGRDRMAEVEAEGLELDGPGRDRMFHCHGRREGHDRRRESAEGTGWLRLRGRKGPGWQRRKGPDGRGRRDWMAGGRDRMAEAEEGRDRGRDHRCNIRRVVADVRRKGIREKGTGEIEGNATEIDGWKTGRREGKGRAEEGNKGPDIRRREWRKGPDAYLSLIFKIDLTVILR